MKEKHITIIDQIGRILLGKPVNETDNTITINNPVILHLQPSQNGQLELQIFPLFFYELLDKANKEKNLWTFDKRSITIGDVDVNPDILARYELANKPQQVQPEVKNPKVISIDDL